MFKHAIVRTPCAEMTEGLSDANLGKPNYERALEQHDSYTEALKRCGVEVTVLPAESSYPDSCFVEDVALCTPIGAILTCPGAESRRGEVDLIREVISKYFDRVASIDYPNTVDAGDIMMVGDHFYIGLSERTNKPGADMMINYLNSFGYTGETVNLTEMLHLKTGMSYLENNNILVSGKLSERDCFKSFNFIHVDEKDAYSSNSVWVNGTVIMPSGYGETSEKVRKLGYEVIEVDMSEFEKLDGGVSCLSLRF